MATSTGYADVAVRPGDWLPATALLKPDVLRSAIRQTGPPTPAPPHVSAALWWKSYTYHVALGPVLRWFRGEPVHDVGLSGVEVLLGEQGDPPRLRAAAAPPTPRSSAPHSAEKPPAPQVPDTPALTALVDGLIERHLGPLGEVLHGISRVGNRSVWGLTVAGCAFALLDDDRATQCDLDRLLAAIPSPYSDLLRPAHLRDAEGRQRPFPLRRSCCLHHRLPYGDRCLTCPLLSGCERQERAAARGSELVEG